MTLQPAAVLFPDVELWASTFLRAALAARAEPYAANVFVSNQVPPVRRDRMVIVRRDGGTPEALRDQAYLSVRVWATTEQDATDLARLVTALLWSAPTGDPVLMVRQQSGASPVADESGQPLRFIVMEIHTRGEALA